MGKRTDLLVVARGNDDPVWEIVRDAIGFRGLSQLLGPKSLC